MLTFIFSWIFLWLPLSYIFSIIQTKYTPIITFFLWIRNFLIALKNKIFEKKEKQQIQEIVEMDPFAHEIIVKKPITSAQKGIDVTANEISKIIVEIGKIIATIDKRIQYFFLFLLNVFFITGLVYNIMWAITYWKASLIVIALFIEWITWIKNTNPKKS